ncbi:MAG: cytochrome c oxidase assembly protein [Gammaproteobacteria bacterium]
MYLRLGLFAACVLRIDPATAHGLAAETEVARYPLMLGGLLLAVVWTAYAIGARRVRPTTERWLTFQGASLIAALIMLDVLDGRFVNSSALHMLQHLLLMVVIAPLFVLAQPLPQWLAAGGKSNLWLWKPLIRLSRSPLWAGCLQSLVIWFWHAPAFYNLALASPGWHLVEHACFVLGAGLFWWSVLRGCVTTALLSVLFTLMHTGMLGAVLTFAQSPLYDDANDLKDQQLAGLIMWVPGGLAYLVAAGWCGSRLFLSDSERSCSKWN